MDNVIEELYKVINERKLVKSENSYTCYLFEKGIDKILKKIGEESAETIIAAKNGVKEDTVNEISDLVYHLLVMMSDQGITPDDVNSVLHARSQKIGNLKTPHKSDRNT